MAATVGFASTNSADLGRGNRKPCSCCAPRVNFLLHRHLAEIHTSSRAAGAGAMLPDLWRMADRRVRPAGLTSPGGTDRLGKVLAGIRHHMGMDRWFHGDRVFTEGEKLVAARIREAGLTAKRMVLLAHPIWEMCLDGALLRRMGFEATRSAVAEGFSAIRGEAEAEAARIHHFERIERTEEERERFSARMKRLFDEIERGPWIEGYQHGEGLAFRVSGIRARLGLPTLDEADHARLGGTLDVTPRSPPSGRRPAPVAGAPATRVRPAAARPSASTASAAQTSAQPLALGQRSSDAHILRTHARSLRAGDRRGWSRGRRRRLAFYPRAAISCGSGIRSPRTAALMAVRRYAFGSSPQSFALSTKE